MNPSITEGYYQVPTSGEVFRVVANKTTGTLYAKRLDRNSFQYARGMIHALQPEWRMTLDQAKAYGKQFGVCCICARTLTDPESIALGIGPVCETRIVGTTFESLVKIVEVP